MARAHYLNNVGTRATGSTLSRATWLETGAAAPGTASALPPPDEEPHQHHARHHQGEHYWTECVALDGINDHLLLLIVSCYTLSKLNTVSTIAPSVPFLL